MNKVELNLFASDNFLYNEAFKVLRTNFQFCGQDIKSVVITSYEENEGKTTVALYLSKALSELGKKVLLIDADMRKSVLAGRNSNFVNAPGLSELLTGMSKTEDIIFNTQYEGMHIIFAGKYPPNPVELVSSKYFDTLLDTVGKSYDYIIIDAPPLGRVIDAAVIASKTDGSILVIDENMVKIKEAQGIVSQLKKSGSNILGVVKNRVRRKESRYYKKSYSARRKK